MAQPTSTRKTLRQAVIGKLYPTRHPTASVATGDGSTTTIVDSTLFPGGSGRDYVGAWAYVVSQPATDSGGDTAEAVDTSETEIDVDNSGGFTVGDYVKIDDEVIGPLTAKDTSGTDITGARGAQGTTAAEHDASTDIYIVGAAIGEVARVSSVDFAGATSTLILSPAIGALVEDTAEYELHYKLHPSYINDKLDMILGLLRQNVLLPVTLVVDGDMEASDASDWTGSSNATLGKVATYVRRGRQSLAVYAAAADSYAISTGVSLPGGTECIVAADVYMVQGGAKLTLYDVTNAADIGTPMEADIQDGGAHLEGTFIIPATCKLCRIHAMTEESGKSTYWDHVTLWPTYDQGIELPSFLEFVYDVKGLFYLPVGTALTGSENVNAYRINEGSPQFYAHYQKERDDTGVVSARFYVDDKRPTNALWIKGRKPYPAFSGATDALKDVDTTQAHRYVVTNMTTASILDDLALDATEAEKPQLSGQLQIKAMMLRNEISGIMASMTPPKKKIVTTPFTRD